MPNFQFIETGHKYLLDDRELISVTQCLPYNYRGNNQQAMEKGRYIHEMCRLYLLDDLDEGNLDPVLVPYLDALKKFLHESKGMGITGVFDIKSGAKTPTVELQVPAYIALVNHGLMQHETGSVPLTDARDMFILEIPFYHPVYQYSGTPDIIIGNHLIREGYALYLKDNGKYSLSPVKDIRKNFEQFLHHFLAYKWDKEKGLI